MTREQREEMRRLLGEAMQGEWTLESGDTVGNYLVAGDGLVFAEVTDDWMLHNAALIVAAVNALPQLLDDAEVAEAARRFVAARQAQVFDGREFIEAIDALVRIVGEAV